ncbi:hypothetical protein ABN034_24195 [Actinopolymorpha sp. B11F2]|uniref:hypothetical protein n=1 Tax=Actinopolymorpha sp. B11F2 TaxID=3160862 RepID=UPI0032E473E3
MARRRLLPTYPMAAFFRAVWAPTGESVVVKLNACAIELDWMSVVSRRAPGLVPHVYASGRRLGDVDVGWLVMRRAPHHIDSGSHDDCRNLMLAAGGPLLLIDPLPRIANWAWDAAYADALG